MKNLVRGLFACTFALVLAVAANAEEKKPQPKKPAVNPLFTFDKRIKPAPTDEQVKKLADLEKEYGTKLAEFQKDAQKKLAGIFTAERVKARKEAVEKAKADGKKGGELAKIGQEALKLTKDEQQTIKEVDTARGKLIAEITKKKMDLLTADQKDSLKTQPKKPVEKKPGEKKPTEKKPEEKKPTEKKPVEKKVEEKK